MPKRSLLLLGAVIVPTACDQTVYPAPGVYTGDWNGVSALMADHCEQCHAPGNVASSSAPLPDGAPQGSYLLGGVSLPFGVEQDVASGYGYYVGPGHADTPYQGSDGTQSPGSLFYLILLGKDADFHKTIPPLNADFGLMPLASQGLRDDQIAAVKKWIDDGACIPSGDTATCGLGP